MNSSHYHLHEPRADEADRPLDAALLVAAADVASADSEATRQLVLDVTVQARTDG